MTTKQAAVKLQELNREQRRIVYAMQQNQQGHKVKRYKLNKGMCLFWLNALGLIAFVASNVAIKIMY